VIEILTEIYYIDIFDEIGNKNMSMPEQVTFPSQEDIANALRTYGGYSAKIDKRFKLAE
jgi:hypothetical protein